MLLESVEELGFRRRALGQEPLKGFEQSRDMPLVSLETTPAAMYMQWLGGPVVLLRDDKA